MKAIRLIVIVVLAYIGLVALFESLLGYFQPANQSTLVITTTDADGSPHERVVARLESRGQLYVAANHWPRAWYRQALANPGVAADLDGEIVDLTAVPVSGAEHNRVDDENSLGLGFRFLTGFPPRYFVRLEPR